VALLVGAGETGVGLGDIIGGKVGWFVSQGLVGTGVGRKVGLLDGLGVGLWVGMRVGAALGASLGLSLGSLLGAGVITCK